MPDNIGWPGDSKYCADEFDDWCHLNKVELGWKRDQIWWDCWATAIFMARKRAGEEEEDPPSPSTPDSMGPPA
ncbi:hypothetical protein LCGC14_1226390 [marine sediment metagenome]|uniref:Uncharacterized protein n=1 Tax=marine sediment metagenome TaxID=412755 RepID=A0A0F9NS08_9ZZZZ